MFYNYKYQMTITPLILLKLLVVFAFTYTRQDSLRIKLSKHNKFEVLGKRECCKLISKWKFENVDDKEYRIFLDIGIRQICNDNTFPLFVNKTNCEYLIINNVLENNVSIINILENKKNTYPIAIDPSILIYHKFLIENRYNPIYYELKKNNFNQFLNILYLNLLDQYENDAIKFKKHDYMKFLEMQTKHNETKHNETKHNETNYNMETYPIK